MIGFFPEPYEDELFFSICSRYHRQAGYLSKETTLRDLFGRRRVAISPDLPCHIGALVDSLPTGHRYSVQQMIDQHTLLPFYAPFVSDERVLRTRNEMENHRQNSLHGGLGVNTTKRKLEFLRYCPGCVEADRNRLGETYWHRLHHVPGVDVCPVHRARLKDSVVAMRHGMGREVFVAAEETIPEAVTGDCDSANSVLPAQLKIANDVSWLLARPALSGYKLGHRERYLRILFERGLSTYSGTLNTKSLTEGLVAYYSAEFLETLGCALRNWPERSWISELVSGSQHAHPPLHHLLLLQFLGFPIEAFFTLLEKRPLPFGEPPWPCLNRTNSHFGENLIWKCSLSCTQRNGRPPRGTFRCSCGFTYSRVGPDASDSDRLVIDRYIKFGKGFEEKVDKMLEEGCPKREIARQLALAPRTLEELIRSKHSRVESVDRRRAKKRTVEEMQRLQKLNRGLLIDAVEQWPDAGRTEIRHKLPTSYNWLYMHDRTWLNAKLPPHKPVGRPKARINWDQMDVEFVAAVRAEAEEMRALPGRPVRITPTAIARKVKIVHLVTKRPQMVPLTVKALSELAEGVDDYVIRRIWWAASCYREEGICPRAGQLGVKAGLRWEQSKSPKFKHIIDEIVSQLNDQICLRYS